MPKYKVIAVETKKYYTEVDAESLKEAYAMFEKGKIWPLLNWNEDIGSQEFDVIKVIEKIK